MLRPWNWFRLAILPGFSLLLIVSAGGCGHSRSEGLPSDKVARQALEAALTTWRDGGKPGPVAGIDPPVEVHDTPWSLGERLSSFEIVQQDQSASEMRFSVRLSLAKPERVQEVQYYVLGRAPVMVFRDEDYMRNINMVNGPSVTKPASSRGKRRR